MTNRKRYQVRFYDNSIGGYTAPITKEFNCDIHAENSCKKAVRETARFTNYKYEEVK